MQLPDSIDYYQQFICEFYYCQISADAFAAVLQPYELPNVLHNTYCCLGLAIAISLFYYICKTHGGSRFESTSAGSMWNLNETILRFLMETIRDWLSKLYKLMEQHIIHANWMSALFRLTGYNVKGATVVASTAAFSIRFRSDAVNTYTGFQVVISVNQTAPPITTTAATVPPST